MNTLTSGSRPPFEQWFGPQAPDATYGYDLPDLLAVEPCPEPSGFAAHWRARYRRALQVDTAAVTTPMGRDGEHELFTVQFTSTDQRQIGGWLALPADGPARRAVVQSHGYGGRDGPDDLALTPGTAVLWPVARGQPSASLAPDLPTSPHEHVLVGIESSDTYILGGCVEDLWCAATVLLEVAGSVPLGFIGGSFGGGVGALALPWDERFRSAALRVPSFGQHDLRLQMPCTGSGESVRTRVAAAPETREVLRYFDASSAAARITIPVLTACALWDPAVPPPGQFAVHNAIPDGTLHVMSAGHAQYPGDAAELADWNQRLRQFLGL